jgi:hypothetical protein
MVSGATTPVAMINKKAIPCTHPFEVSGFPPLSIGVSTLNLRAAAPPNRASSTAAELLARLSGS